MSRGYHEAMTRRRTVMWVSLLALAGGCTDDGHPPAAPPADGSVRGTPPPSTGRDDAGLDAGTDGDGGGLDAGVVGCTVADPSDTGNRLEVTQVGTAEPFELERVWVMWDDTDCDDPHLLVGLTNGGFCAPGVEQQLLFSLAEDAVPGSVSPGTPYVLSADASPPLSVRFTRPSVLDPDRRDVFGTCSSLTDGSIEFSAVGTEDGADLTATFSAVQLAPCTAGLEGTSVTVSGAFDVVVPVALEAVCP